MRMFELFVFIMMLALCARPAQQFAIPSLPFEDCGSVVDLRVVQISSCRTAPCRIPINEPVTLTAEFANVGSQNTANLRHEAFWVLNSVNTRAQITPDSCDGNRCPFNGPDGLAFSVDLRAPKGFPALRGTLFWRVYSSSGRIVMCFRVPIALVQ